MGVPGGLRGKGMIDIASQHLLIFELLVIVLCCAFMLPPLLQIAISWRGKGTMAPLRLASALLCAGLLLASGWSLLANVDIWFFNQRYLGPAAQRSHIATFVWFPLAIALPLFLWFFRGTLKHFARGNKNGDTS